ncbi:heavy metal translocating P-type ATPase [Azomonas macrocytogenes]|uniref:P-type Zn(2+) transporter n=1 Tax=Azomonas macrocytogenes TaxID=69962 RepID=A0A839T246_AZOMA|nr:heavy metal translocating P-type ATPase [Azomonas macrocytogenes]MBB3102576.1 Cu2+-exporting ATPase [Azomonas macrocytogenes]
MNTPIKTRQLAASAELASHSLSSRTALIRQPSGSATPYVDVSQAGLIKIVGAPFIADPTGLLARSFFERAFGDATVDSVSIDMQKETVEIRYSANDSNLAGQIVRLSRLIAGAIKTEKPVALPVTWGRGGGTRIRLHRYGKILSGWAVKHEIQGRIRFENPVLLRRRALHQALEAELINALGVDKFSIQELTGSVLIHYNPKQIQKHQIVELLDTALEKTEDFTLSPIDLDLPVSAASIIVSAASQFLFPLLTPLSAALFIYSVIPSFKGAYDVVVKEKRLGVDLLDAIVVSACLATNQIFAGSVLAMTLSISRKLVERTERDSKRMLLNVFGKQPRFVWLDVDGTAVETPLEKIKNGDVIIIHTGESVPVDGEVVDGMAMIDQHALTGESAPAEKIKGDKVLASTTLIAGKVRVAVTSAGQDTTAAKLAKILNETSGHTLKAQSKGQALADRAVAPTLGLGALGLVTRGANSAVAVANCDLGTGIRMAAPIAMLSSLTLAAQRGILVKSGRALETMSEIDTFLFDKTGTLTRERPEVGRILTFDKHDENQILAWAAAAENKFSHPIAKAVLDRFNQLGQPIPETDETKYAVGYGITVGVEGHLVHVGSARFLTHEGISLPTELDREIERVHDEGNSLIVIGVDGVLGGALELKAAQRNEAQFVIDGLRARGAKHLAIISGDHEQPTRNLAHKLGMDRYFAEVLPQDKARYVRKLQKEGRRVCFIGDGVNDSIALKQADVSISLRGASSIAIDTAQVVFMEEDLEKLLQLYDVADALQRNIKRSWRMIVGANAACIAGALFGNFGVMHSMVFNQIGGLLAVGNGLLPLREAAKLQREKDELAYFIAAHSESIVSN